MKRLALLGIVAVACAAPPRESLHHATHGAGAGHEMHSRSPVAPSAGLVGSLAFVDVTPDGGVRTLAEALRVVAPGGRITVHPGTYREHGIVIGKPVTIIGHGYPTIDAESAGEIITIAADDVTVRGLRLTRVGVSFVEDRAAIRVSKASGCAIEDNHIDDAFFGIYLAEARKCRVARNILRASGATEAESGNGIHLWSSRDVDLDSNVVIGHRDGIYFEFVHDTRITGNVSERNLRYGLHFMYSDACTYVGNIFRHNGSGVAVMFTKRVEMFANRFEGNRGPAAYGLLLKEIADSRLEHNVFAGNTTGLLADGANRLVAAGNTFLDNGWAVKLDASTLDGRFTGNDFIGNTFDVATNSREHTTSFSGNYWDSYHGYDLDGDGVGDVPFRPVRLFSLVVQEHQPAIALLRSGFVSLLDAAERVIPSLTPDALTDARPRMRRSS